MPKARRCRVLTDPLHLETGWKAPLTNQISDTISKHGPSPNIQQLAPQAREIDPLYLFACHIEWEKREDPSAGWELIAAGQSSNSNTRAHAHTLLAGSHHLGGTGLSPAFNSPKRHILEDQEVKVPYGLEIIENCAECALTNSSFFCGFSRPVLESLNQISHKSAWPAGAILFVEEQLPRGMFILCSGKVNLSTTSRAGKMLILRTALPGEALGLSATISGMGYETTAETVTPCQINFIDRKHFLELMQANSETGVHAAQCLAREYQSAYRDIHDLVLTRSSTGKLARLLLSQSPIPGTDHETRISSLMTHEEMAQRIGASRETVTRLLSTLRRKHLIRLDGSGLIIHDRTALEALAV